MIWNWIVNNDDLIAIVVVSLLGLTLLGSIFSTILGVSAFTLAIILIGVLAWAYDYTQTI